MNSGIILIDKPQGISSFQAVYKVRKKTGIKKVGHTGTLDPMATGLLTICLGRATRMARFLTEASTTYVGSMTLGVETDSYDSQGMILSDRPVPPALTREDLQETADRFTGCLKQPPPAFSAAKHRGVPLYRLARKGIKVHKEPRDIKVYRFSVDSYKAPVLSFTIECSKGTYIRSLAHDFGKAAGCGAHLSSLRRTKNGEQSVEGAVFLDDFLDSFEPGEKERWILPVEFVLSYIPGIFVDPDQALSIQHGQGLSLEIVTRCLEEQMPGVQRISSRYLRILTREDEKTSRLVCMAGWPEISKMSGEKDKIEILRVWNPN
jgi:tRNA pseudouridine55 synthase